MRLTTAPELQKLLATLDPNLLIVLKHVQARVCIGAPHDSTEDRVSCAFLQNLQHVSWHCHLTIVAHECQYQRSKRHAVSLVLSKHSEK